jgi:ketosteroid isomerase-like protein
VKADDVRAFLAGYGEAWDAIDVDAIVAHYALPQIVVAEGRTTFVETEDEVRAGVETLCDLYDDKGVATIRIEVEAVEPLPDHAARAVVRWRLLGEGDAELTSYEAAYTIVEDDDGILAIVAVDGDGQVAAHRAAGWVNG